MEFEGWREGCGKEKINVKINKQINQSNNLGSLKQPRHEAKIRYVRKKQKEMGDKPLENKWLSV